MSPEELRAKAARLYELTGSICPWPIETAHDLREWLLNLVSDRYCDDQLTGGESRRLWGLLEELDDELASPEERARKIRRAKKKEKEEEKQQDKYGTDKLEAILSVWEERATKDEQCKTFHEAGAAARTRIGAPNREQIIRRYKNSTLEKRERVASIADSLNLTPQWVGRVLRKAGLK